MKNTRKLIKPMATHTKQQILPLLALILLSEKASSQPKPGCPGNCGSISIPYPFGITKNCSLDESFLINCTQTNSTTAPTPFLAENNTILNITLDGELRISSTVPQVCSPDGLGDIISESSFNLSNFFVSSRRNKFTTIGCDTLGVIFGRDSQGRNYTTGCISFCNTLDEISANGSCSGTGCCQTSIPPGLSSVDYGSSNVSNQSQVLKIHPCGYAFVADEDACNFTPVDVRSFRYQSLPVVVDWAVGNKTCQEAQNEISSYACKAEHSECQNSTNGIGYLCNCSSGFQGNPYLLGGCTDIDECLVSNPCVGSCFNLPGSYKCSCQEGYEGDGMKNGTGCQPKSADSDNSTSVRALAIALGMSLGLLALLFGSFSIYFGIKKRKLIKLREKYFIQNGGVLLQQQISRYQGLAETTKIFTTQELKNATNNYDPKRILGQGGHGTVYKGILADNKVVAIKKSKISDQSQIEQFINEVIILSQINHRNIVKLLGCCLEIEVPLLVYEFISNGTLFDHIHNQSKSLKLSWDIRLKIVAETAGVLAYLHSATSTPIIHRDIKTTNILLDHNLTAKVSDFEASKLVPLDQTQLTTLVQGTLGYLDPEYFQTSQLTEKSDVYSFGVVLAELLTSKEALSFVRPGIDRNLSMYFISSMKEGQLAQILDKHMINDTNVEHIMEVANLAKMCLNLKGEDRPSMKEVVTELDGLRIAENMRHPWRGVDVSAEESEFLLKELETSEIVDAIDSEATTSGFNSLNIENLKPLADGR